MNIVRITAAFAALLFSISVHTFSAGNDPLLRTIEGIVSSSQGTIGVAVLNIESGDTLSVNGANRFPMQSVFKFPIGLAVLHRVDDGTLILEQKVLLPKELMTMKTWSPLRERYPNGDTLLTLDEILRATVAQSDNVGCDLLFRMLGGPSAVHAFIQGTGVKDIAIRNTEGEMAKDETLQYKNYCTPTAMAQLLARLYRGKVLKESTTRYMVSILEQTTTGPKRLKGSLPAGTVVAHKTGSSGTNAKGITAATNDAGVITLTDGSHVAVVVFVSDSPADDATREGIIARIAKAVWDDAATKK